MYQVSDYSKERAKILGVEIKSSQTAGKKLDVYHQGLLIASIGDMNYSDYPTYLSTRGKEYADERKRLYHMRHKSNGLRELLSLFLLW
jgi:hypothetical protein